MSVKNVLIEKEFIFEDERPFKSCHASTLLVLPNDDILSAWFGGTAEKNSDVAIWYSRRSADSWGKPVKIADEEGIAHWNPVLFQTEDKTIHLFYKVGHEIRDWQTRVITSKDNGYTWTSPRELVDGDIGGRGPVRSKPIQLKDRTMIAPASIERLDPKSDIGKQIWEAFVDISYDQGETWEKSEIIALSQTDLQGEHKGKARGVIQPTLWETDENRIHMLLRSTEGAIYRSDSDDKGKTWSKPYRTNLPNNNSGIDVVKVNDEGLLALVWNPVGADWGARTPLVVSVSHDNGETWKEEITLEHEKGEYSYPAIVSKDQNIYITYTWNRERIAFWRISLQ